MELMGDGIAKLEINVLGQTQSLEFWRNLIWFSDIGDKEYNRQW
jgi:hypothetical protein